MARADLNADAALAVKFLRSDRAHADILSIDTTEAAALDGVIAIVTGRDIESEITPLPVPSAQPLLEASYPVHWPLAVDRVRFHGEPVAMIIATSKYIAEDAAELIYVDYEDRPYIADYFAATEEGAPRLYDDWDDNNIFTAVLTGGIEPEEQEANAQAVNRIIDGAPYVHSRRYKVHRTGCAPLETRGALISWREGEGLSCWLTTQRPHIDRLILSDVLDLPYNQIKVNAPKDQGGAFGVKAPVYREPIIIAHMARKLKAKLRWVESREEHLMAVSQERDQVHDLELAADNEGKFLALRDRNYADVGDGCEGVFWGYIMPFYGSALLPNGYDLPNCHLWVDCAVTNKSALSPARAFGTFAGRFALDRAVHDLAISLDLEPADVIRKNLISELPYDTASGVHYDYGNFVAVWDRLIEEIDLPAFRERQSRELAEGKYVGLGLSTGVHASGVASEALVPMEGQPGYGSATLRMDPRGSVTVFEGDAPQGQGHETTMAQIVAEILGLDPDSVSVEVGDAQTTPFASGTFGARGGSYTASAVALAAKAIRDKIATVFAHDNQIEADPDAFEFAEGKIVYLKSNNVTGEVADIADRIIMRPLDLPEGVTSGLEHTAFFEAKEPMVSFSAHAAIVSVDIETGEMSIERYVTSEDVGRVINPQIVEGQVHGGLVQGISNTMFEEFVYDEDGQQLSSSLENYKIANASDVPNFEVFHADTPCKHTPLGSRGLGEGTPGPVPAALTNAVVDALKPFGIEINELPLRPDRVLAKIAETRAP